MLILLVGNFVHRLHITWLPESLIAVVFGALLNLILWATPSVGDAFSLDMGFVVVVFSTFLNLVALPVIIFEAGWALRLRDFFSQLGYILGFAVVGTVISVLVIGSLMLQVREHLGITDDNVAFRTAFSYAALISSVDPVATLATFGSLNVDRLLFILVFGESQINDAVAITLFNAFNGKPATLGTLILRTLGYLFGSIGLGLGVGIIFVLILRFGKMIHSPVQEILFITLLSSFTFQLAEVVKMSGIITVLFCAILVSAYAGPHLSIDGMMLTSFLLKQLATLCELTIFLFCGFFAVGDNKWEDIITSLWLMLFVLIGRAVAVFPLGLLTNAMKYAVKSRLPAESKHMLSWKHMFMMWHGGLCRGGVSLWMAFEWGDWMEPEMKRRFTKATCFLILVFLVVFGGTTSAFMYLLQLPMGKQLENDELYGDEEDSSATRSSGKPWRMMMYLNRKVMIPLLVGGKKKDAGEQTLISDVIHSQDRTSGRVLERLGSGIAARRRSGNINLARACSSTHTGYEAQDVFDLFGTGDPAHIEQLEDISEMLQENSDEESLDSSMESSDREGEDCSATPSSMPSLIEIPTARPE
eukprot:CAMPEP_0197640296 /NCGR_PEP_ID=MMETSP1338-20131121/14637_1 /TAXON_ID=43686 ORGANISM="Pelagodinium beii, Strain RCC1491" /NCGR_SAMPLE_ID=MMETSP1338 /ASSEMBLY_ACC=CAM_ASM_000754 /LENGTH=585 /DNA_ID=CAMNT_0043213131 /DNA_START=44 /DNA_END=1799 /DNA_ORIENTATION=+